MALDAGDNYTSFDYKFQLPTDCLRVICMIDVENETYGAVDDDYKIEGAYLYCSYAEIGIRYIKQLTSPGDLDTSLGEAVILNLAAKTAFAITKDRSLETSMVQQYQMALVKAKSADGYERVNRVDSSSNWVDIG